MLGTLHSLQYVEHESYIPLPLEPTVTTPSMQAKRHNVDIPLRLCVVAFSAECSETYLVSLCVESICFAELSASMSLSKL